MKRRPARGESAVPGPSGSKTAGKQTNTCRSTTKNRDVTTGFDSSEQRESTDKEEPSDEDTNIPGKGKGIGKAGGRPPADALTCCDALGKATRAEALVIVQEYNLHPQTVPVRAGLVLKATKVTNVSNAVRCVFAHNYRLKNDGGMFDSNAPDCKVTEHSPANTPDGAAEEYYDSWKTEHGDEPEEHKAQLEAARNLDDEAALDGITVNQLRSQALNISKQITQLISISRPYQCLTLIIFSKPRLITIRKKKL